MMAVSDQLNKIHNMTSAKITAMDAQAREQLKSGNTKGAVDSLNEMMDFVEAKNTMVNKALNGEIPTIVEHAPGNVSVSFSKPPADPIIPKVIPEKTTLPKGINGGKTAAIVAGIGLLTAGGVMLYRSTHKPKTQPGTWANRIEQERLQPQRGPAL